jgi:hypothetical protein
MFGVFRRNIKLPPPHRPGGGVNSSEVARPQDAALYSICIVNTLRLLVYTGKNIGLNNLKEICELIPDVICLLFYVLIIFWSIDTRKERIWLLENTLINPIFFQLGSSHMKKLWQKLMRLSNVSIYMARLTLIDPASWVAVAPMIRPFHVCSWSKTRIAKYIQHVRYCIKKVELDV